MSGGSDSHDESFFNDLSRRPPSSTNGETPRLGSNGGPNDSEIPKPKRIACVLCRKRKLRCDGSRPACGTCKRLSHDCAYDEVRRKSGPKRGYVKLLEQRLQQVETMLKTQDPPEKQPKARSKTSSATPAPPPYVTDTQMGAQPAADHGMFSVEETSPLDQTSAPIGLPETNEDPYGWEMIGLGLDEPLPEQSDINELTNLYFQKFHPSAPMIHRRRFYAAMNLTPQMRPPVCLRYIMWCLAASLSDKYESLQELFYQRARKYAQSDEMRGHGEATITLGHCQAWALISTYEFRMMYFPRAWMSSGRASRLALMMGLGRQDGIGLDVKQCLAPPKDWTEREERRRTFWAAFCVDRYASIGTGWPMCIDEKDISSNLPVTDEAFDNNKPMASITLPQVFTPTGSQNLSSFGGVIVTACLFGRNLHHLHRPSPEDNESDLKGGFWKRHQEMDDLLLNLSLHVPDNLRLPSALSVPNAIFFNLCLQTSVICLHQAAIFKSDKFRLPPHVSNESKKRAINAAAEVASIMRSICHMELAAINPFISFCIYVAARVFVQYVKNRPQDHAMQNSLRFLLQSMLALRRRNPLTQSFMVQLDLDLDGAGIQGLRLARDNSDANGVGEMSPGLDNVACNPLYEIRDNQQQTGPKSGGPVTGPPLGFDPSQQGNKASDASFSSNSPSGYLNTGDCPGGIIVPVMSDGSRATSEMDTDPGGDTPSTSTSRNGSSSHPSYTSPSSNIDDVSQTSTSFSMPNMHTTVLQGVRQDLSGLGTSDATAGFFATSQDYVGLNGHYYTTNGLQNPAPSAYQMQPDWDMVGAASSTMNDSGWAQMLDGMGMTWDVPIPGQQGQGGQEGMGTSQAY